MTTRTPPINPPTRRHPARKGLACAVVLALVAAITVLATPAGAAAATATTVPVGEPVNAYNAASGRCADVPGYGAGQVDGPVNQYDCDYTSADNQRWVLDPQGEYAGYPAYQIRNYTDGLCMDVPAYGPVGEGALVSQYHCAPEPELDNQKFYLQPTTVPDAYFVVNVKTEEGTGTKLCLDVAGLGSGIDARLTLWPCSSTDDHLWMFRTSAAALDPPAHGWINTTGTPLTERAEPDTASESLGALADDTEVIIECQTLGTEVAGPYGTSRLWNKVVSDNSQSGDDTAWIADAYTRTGSDGQVAPACPVDIVASGQDALEDAGATPTEAEAGATATPPEFTEDACALRPDDCTEIVIVDDDPSGESWIKGVAHVSLDVGQELSGYNDAEDCLAGSPSGCAWLAGNFFPPLKFGKVSKLFRSGDEASDAAKTADEVVDLASASRRSHILDSHRYGGEAGNSWFPEGWSDDKIMHEISDIATDPSLTWLQQTGTAGAEFTRGGAPVRYTVEGVRDGTKIRVVLEPGGEGIITGFPIL